MSVVSKDQLVIAFLERVEDKTWWQVMLDVEIEQTFLVDQKDGQNGKEGAEHRTWDRLRDAHLDFQE